MNNNLVITSTKTLQHQCKQIMEEKFITIDTEFMRDRTYWAELCLIQIGTSTHNLIIDCLIPQIDLSPLKSILTAKQPIKVIHSVAQDAEVLWQQLKIKPSPIYDTQIAAALCGFERNIAYHKLVKIYSNYELDKTHQYSDWISRPISEEKITYAANDVSYLRKIYKKLHKELEKYGRNEWVTQETEQLINSLNLSRSPELAWKKRNFYSHSSRITQAAKHITFWREKEAAKLNVPKNLVLSDATIFKLAKSRPRNIQDFSKPYYKSLKIQTKYHAIIIETLELAKSEVIKQKEIIKPPLPYNSEVVDLLMIYLTATSKEQKISPLLIASKKEIKSLVASPNDPEHKLLMGWRFEIFGKMACKLIKGQAKIYVLQNQILCSNE